MRPNFSLSPGIFAGTGGILEVVDTATVGRGRCVGRTKRAIYVTLGTICVGLGALGVVLPLMPTTVFLLLAAFFYSRSSDRFHAWLMHNRVFGEYVRNYHEGRGMTAKHKARALIMLWATIALSLWLVDSIIPRVALMVVATGVSVYLLVFLKTYRPHLDRREHREHAHTSVAPAE